MCVRAWSKREREREEEKNGEEVIKTSLIYRTYDYVRQSSYAQCSDRVVVLGKAMNKRKETLSNENINNDKCETDFLHPGANEMDDRRRWRLGLT